MRSAWKCILLIPIVLAALALASCSAPADQQAITSAVEQYVRETSGVQQMRVEVEKVEDDWARARVTPLDVETDPAYVFLKRESGQWKGMLLGTAFGPEDYADLGIPASLQLQPVTP